MKTLSVIDTPLHIGKTIDLFGWIDTKRDHRKIVFLDIRDRTGIVQVIGDEKMKSLTPESVVLIKGLVKKRPEKLINPKIPTGEIEIEVTSFEVLSKANTLPLPIDTDGHDIDEEVRLKYRYLDLRRDRMSKSLRLRSDYFQALRIELHERKFTEVETPMLTKSTKEGARDFLVPSRLQQGKFYALPQSPQQYKQLLMVAGVERYFQFARCIRDEDLRADRGFEHTQLDLEMSFVNRDEVMATVEEIVKKAIHHVGGKLQHDTFPVIDYTDAISKYGQDKFDLRSEKEKEKNILAFAWVVNFPFFKKVNIDDTAEVRDGKSGWTFTHNPFSMPKDEFLASHLSGSNIDKIQTTQYDLVCNGYEAGGGSIRAHTPEILEATFKIMGYSKEETEENVGHMLEAFKYGTPPHGGIALGLDRHVMILSGENSLKESIAFPMSSGGKTAVMDAPSIVADSQLAELGISVKPQD
ncbi:MAG: amino acid--tRNA ligase-related protein [Candidatus Roizmanbacteria bacterium]|nr:amino acid--tRNA ligase-related protein [Candidatus Roizmanbacteria bacterium]